MLIGLTGPRLSGKTKVASILKEKGFISFSFGDEVRLERDARELPKDYDLHNFAVDLRSEFGPQYWGARVLGRIPKEDDRNCVVEGMRTIGDYTVFRKFQDFILVGINASLDTRYQRLVQNNRGRPDDIKDFDDFVSRCERDESSGPEGLQSAELFKMAEYVIDNSSSIYNLRMRVEELLEKL